MGTLIDMSEAESGLLVVIEKAPPDSAGPSKGALWLARCRGCGSVRAYRGIDLRRGSAKSCGCSTAAVISESRKTHGATRTPEYKAWRSMIDRCERKTHRSYCRYGAKGVAVCPQWRHDFPAFFREVGQKPSAEYTLERVSNSRGYEPGNVRWATRIEQARNRSSNRYIEFRGARRTIAEWSEVTGIPQDTIRRRLESGQSPEATLTRPHKTRGHMLRHDGRSQTVSQWARELGMQVTTLFGRLALGWDTQRIVSTPVDSRRGYHRKAD